MEIEYPSEIIQDIMMEIDDGKIDAGILMERAEKIREERIAKRLSMPENKPKLLTLEEIEKSEDEEFEKNLKKIKESKDPEWTLEEIKDEFAKKRDLRKVFREIIKNQPVMVSKVMEELSWTLPKKSHTYEMFVLLREMGLIKEMLILEIWAKEFCKVELSKDERDILNKFNFWTKPMKEKLRNKYVGVSGYWILTELGKKQVNLVNRVSISQAPAY